MDGVKTSNPVCSICHVAWRRLDDDETRVEGDEATLGSSPPALCSSIIHFVLTEGKGCRMLRSVYSTLEIAVKRREILLLAPGLFISKLYVVCSESLRAGRSGDRIPVGGGEIFRTRPDRTCGPPSLLHNGYRVSFPEVKRSGRVVDHPHRTSAEVKERVELYLYSLFGPHGLF